MTSQTITFDKISVLLLKELESDSRRFDLFFERLHQLEKRARIAIEQAKNSSAIDAWQNDWNGFIGLLASVFETNRCKPTAAKSSRAKDPKPSPFVAFVWAIMGTLPREFRRHVQSRPAMAKAVAKSLASRRSPKLAGSVPASF